MNKNEFVVLQPYVLQFASIHHRLKETRGAKVKKGKTKRENRAGERETIEAKGDE